MSYFKGNFKLIKDTNINMQEFMVTGMIQSCVLRAGRLVKKYVQSAWKLKWRFVSSSKQGLTSSLCANMHFVLADEICKHQMKL